MAEKKTKAELEELETEKIFRDLLNEDEDEDDEEENEEESEKKDDEENDDDEEEKPDKPEKTPEELAEEERLKNKNAEEARKRREAETKAEKEKAEAEAKAASESKESEEENSQHKELGRQLVEFKKKHPEVELIELDKDASFKNYIEGKLLGKKDFTRLYEEYIELKQQLSGKNIEELRLSYQKKAAAGAKPPSGGSSNTDSSVYTEAELRKISEELPYMSKEKANSIVEKLERSMKFYENK